MFASSAFALRYRQPCVVVMMASTAFLFSIPQRVAGQNRSESDIEDEVRERVLAERLKQFADQHTRQLVEQAAAYVEETGKLMGELEAKASTFLTRFDGLLTNDDGKRLAKHKTAFQTYIRFKDDPVVSVSEVASRRKALDSLLAQLRSELKNLNVGYHPPDTQRRDVDEHFFWARERLSRVEKRSAWLDATLARAPKVADLKAAKPLEAVVRAYEIEQLEFWDIARQKGEAAAKEESEPILIEKARLAELERRLKEAESQIERMRVEQELELKRQRAENEQRLVESETRYRDLMAELDRAKKLSDAERHAKNVEAELKSGQIISEAEKKRLIDKCNDPEVKTILAPFLDKGYFRPSDNMHGSRRYDTVQPVPISFADLQKLGALNPTGSGADMLHKIASAPMDSMRSRWPGFRKKWQDDPGLREKVPKAQQLLIELGPTMVEMKMLQP